VNYGYWPEESHINACPGSDDLTNPAWVKTNCTAAKTATGADGVANSATTLTATAGNATALQTITAASATRVTSAWVKRRTGTGVIEMTQDNGTTWTPVTVTAGGSRLEIPSATVTNPVVGFRIVTSGDAIDVQYVQCEAGAFMTSPIPTTSTATTRSADTCSIATTLFNLSATVGTVISVATTLAPTTFASGLWHFGNAGGSSTADIIASDSNGNRATYVRVASVTQADLSPTGVTSAVEAKYGSAWEANNFAASIDGSVAITDVSGSIPGSIAALHLGKGSGANNSLGNLALTSFKYLPRRVTIAELATETT
jgi:hypothetical protein